MPPSMGYFKGRWGLTKKGADMQNLWMVRRYVQNPRAPLSLRSGAAKELGAGAQKGLLSGGWSNTM